MVRVLVADPIHKDGITMMKSVGLDVVESPHITPDELLAKIGDFEALIVRGRTRVTSQVIESGKRLRLIARSGVGLDNIDLAASRDRKIKVVSTPAAPSTSVAELTVALMLAVLRQVAFADASMKLGKWPKGELMGRELRGKTVGILGAGGRIGLEVASIMLNGFHCRVIGYDIVDIEAKAHEVGFSVATSLDELLQASDIISIHVPYLSSTHHLIGKKQLGLVKPGSILINTSRADVVDGRALLAGLSSGRLAGAGLDVFHDEPPKEDWELEIIYQPSGRTVCTAHIGAQTEECQRLEATTVADELIRFFSDVPP